MPVMLSKFEMKRIQKDKRRKISLYCEEVFQYSKRTFKSFIGNSASRKLVRVEVEATINSEKELNDLIQYLTELKPGFNEPSRAYESTISTNYSS